MVTWYRLEEDVFESKARLETTWRVSQLYNWLVLLFFGSVKKWHTMNKRKKLLEEACLHLDAPQRGECGCYLGLARLSSWAVGQHLCGQQLSLQILSADTYWLLKLGCLGSNPKPPLPSCLTLGKYFISSDRELVRCVRIKHPPLHPAWGKPSPHSCSWPPGRWPATHSGRCQGASVFTDQPCQSQLCLRSSFSFTEIIQFPNVFFLLPINTKPWLISFTWILVFKDTNHLGQALGVPIATHSLWPWGVPSPLGAIEFSSEVKGRGQTRKPFRSSAIALPGCGRQCWAKSYYDPEPRFAYLPNKQSLPQDNLLK